MIQFNSDDLVYNRFDLIYSDDFTEEIYEYNGELYAVLVHKDNESAFINVWGKLFSQRLFDLIIDSVFLKHPDVLQIVITKAYNNYKDVMYETEDIILQIPDSVDELLSRIKTKHRYNLRRNRNFIEETLGAITIENYSKDEIPNEIVHCFFEWKAKTHGTNYYLSEQAYLDKYHVSDCIIVKAGDRPISILFYCKVNSTVYLENLSYDSKFEKYSPGFLGYVTFLEELIHQKCKILYLGGGNYSYKRYFGTDVNKAYSGNIYSNTFYQLVNNFIREVGIENYAIYGIGAFGKSFLKESGKLDAKLSYCIDKEQKEIEGIETYTLDKELPEVDAIFITLKSHNKEVEKFLEERFKHIYYWIDLPRQLYLRNEEKK